VKTEDELISTWLVTTKLHHHAAALNDTTVPQIAKGRFYD
jgi:hypothetical protein